MPAQSKAQKAALLRVQQIDTSLRKLLSKTTDKYRAPSDRFNEGTLLYLEKEFDERLKEVATLVKEHDLGESVLTEFQTKLTGEIYQKADSLKSHAWQARFAKKYGM